MVVFKRYDYNQAIRFEIGEKIYNPPWSVTFDTSVLLPLDNEIDAIVFDAANNSTWIYLFLHHLPVLTVNKLGTGSGVVTSSPTGIDCGSTCSYGFSDNALVTLTAAPTDPSTFTGWGGACSGKGTCTVTMNVAKTVTATFMNFWETYLPFIKR
jgi:hypothetical protein